MQLQAYQTENKFDLIVSNPPYYPAGQPLELQKQQARHTSSLTHNCLLLHSHKLLNDNGRLALVLPSQFCQVLIQQARDIGFFVKRCLQVKTTSNKAVSRMLLEFVLFETETEELQLVIHQQDGAYSQDYQQLARDFYLNF